ADIDDKNSDGISGKPNQVWSDIHQKVMLGRFGWKAGMPNINEQSQSASAGDMGISVPLHPKGSGECTEKQIRCQKAPDGNSPEYENLEAHSTINDLIVFYASNLAVPMRRNTESVLQGKKLFYENGCIGCHQPKFMTQKSSTHPEQSEQLIWPYTDLLLHDMGEGLADNRPESAATGNEWRTPPLWGIGLTETVNGHTLFLHDGRARNISEAILWHGGESEKSKQSFLKMNKKQRDQLIQFVESL
ncbi:MAG: di-heme oxidoredictase family protein, partial [Pseudomonadota bacterium]